MLEEQEDEANVLIDRLNELNKNLDKEIERLNVMIGDAGPRSSTKYSDIAQ